MPKRVSPVIAVLVFALLGAALADSSTKLFDAVQANKLAAVKAMLDKNPKLVNKTDDLKATPLHWAAENGYLDMVKLLISKGANVNAKDQNNGMPLHLAASHRHVEVARLLIKNRALMNVKDVDGWSPLYYAIDREDIAMAKLLIDSGTDLRAKYDPECITLLHLAVEKGNIEICRKLIEKGAKVDAVDGGGNTPLHLAALGGQSGIAALLIENGAAVDAKSREGQTPLHYAISGNHYKIADLLISKGADVNIRGKNSFNPLHMAIYNNRYKLVELLIEHGANINARVPKPEISSLTCYARLPQRAQRKAVVNKKAQSAKAKDETPLAMALRLKYTDIADFLRKHGAVER